MKNDHSWRLSRSPGMINTQGTNCTNSYFRGYVNQIILCRFYGVFQHTRPLFSTTTRFMLQNVLQGRTDRNPLVSERSSKTISAPAAESAAEE
jgi:hypothetical protein